MIDQIMLQTKEHRAPISFNQIEWCRKKNGKAIINMGTALRNATDLPCLLRNGQGAGHRNCFTIPL